MTADPMDRQQYHGLRELGYPIAGPEAPAAVDPPAVILERQAKLCAALAEIHAFAPSGARPDTTGWREALAWLQSLALRPAK